MANQDDERPLCTLGLPVSSIAGGSPLDADELRSLFLQTKNGHRFRDGRSSPVEPEGIEPSSKHAPTSCQRTDWTKVVVPYLESF